MARWRDPAPHSVGVKPDLETERWRLVFEALSEIDQRLSNLEHRIRR